MKEHIKNFILQLVNEESETKTKHKTTTKKDICLAYSIMSNIALILGIIFAIPQDWFLVCWFYFNFFVVECIIYNLSKKYGFMRSMIYVFGLYFLIGGLLLGIIYLRGGDQLGIQRCVSWQLRLQQLVSGL